ncbi:MAG: OsmC family protein, partial [Candidatus Thorarchaeota archaeon]
GLKMSEEHNYALTSRFVKERIVTIEIPGREVIESSPPIDFWSEGPDNTYSPEDLFLASAVTCYAVSIPGVAKRFHADFKDFVVHGKGHLKQGEFGWEFEEMTLNANIVIEKEKDRKKMVKVAERAHRYCIIANSMKCPVHLEYDIVVE